MKSLCSIILLLMMLPLDGAYDSLPKFAQKKVDKTLLELFPKVVVSKQLIELSEEENSLLDFSFSNGELYELTIAGKRKGYAYFSKAPSKFLMFDYMVVFNPSLSIMQSKVLVYREDYGSEIANKRWLTQFDGKSNGMEMEFQKEINTISGATISCQSMTHGIKKLSKQIYQLKEKGLL